MAPPQDTFKQIVKDIREIMSRIDPTTIVRLTAKLEYLWNVLICNQDEEKIETEGCSDEGLKPWAVTVYINYVLEHFVQVSRTDPEIESEIEPELNEDDEEEDLGMPRIFYGNRDFRERLEAELRRWCRHPTDDPNE
jgi:hypothetical protein